MSQLVPCPGCGRHVRLSDSSCPFCSGALDVTALDERYAPRREGVQRGLKRAALFAIGAGVAAACGGETDTMQPVYGAPITDETAPSTDDISTSTNDDSAQPIYGAPVTNEPTSSTNDTSTSTPEPSYQPVYGAPITDVTDSETSEPTAQPLYGAPVFPTEPVFDAGVADAGDAAIDGGDDVDASGQLTGDTESLPTVAPVYGAPPIRQ